MTFTWKLLQTFALMLVLALGGVTTLSIIGCESDDGPIEETTDEIEEAGDEIDD